MTSSAFYFPWRMWLAAIFSVASLAVSRADGRAGAVEWSDGRKLAGAVSLTSGKDLHLYEANGAVSVPLDEVKEIRFTPEKEEMWEGFYFPNAGQATQAKTGEVYPIRYLHTQVTLANGKTVEGHLFTTVFYIETDETTEKVVVMAKQTGANGQKLTDLIYPTTIDFDAVSAAAGFCQIDLTQAGLAGAKPPVILARPDLAFLSAEQSPDKLIWTVPFADPTQILFSVEAADGVHVAWPETIPDPDMQQAVQTGLKVMQDFYDTRTLLGCLSNTDTGDVYSLVMMKRVGKSVSGDGSAFDRQTIPWGLAILRWKYDPEQKKATLLNRASLAMGRAKGNSPIPMVFKQPELLQDISVSK